MVRFKFEELNVYQKALNFCSRIYSVSARFPRGELFGATSQLRRATLSVPLNIAEGSGRDSNAEQRRFYIMARGSMFECIPIIEMALRQNWLNLKEAESLREDCAEPGRMINGLITSLT